MGKIQQKIGIKGIVATHLFEPKTEEDKKLIDLLRNKMIKPDDKRLQRILVQKTIQKNIVTTAGLTAITKGLSDNLTSLSQLKINYTAVGTGTTTPAASDTTLATETYRNTVNSLNYADNVFFASMFINYTEDSGTYYEAGLFINGTSATDSGTLFDRVLLNSPSGVSKTTSQVLTISFQITFSPV